MGTSGSGNSRSVKLSVVAAVVVIGGALIGWKAYASRQPKLDASAEKIQGFVASDKFKDLPANKQKDYADAMFRNGSVVIKGDKLSSEQESAFQNAASAHRQAMLDEYFALPEGKARKDFLDKQIDQQEKVKKMMENPPTTQPGDGPRVMIRKTGGGGAAGQKAMAESIPADQQAKMAQYIHDVQARRTERGLPAGPGGFIMIRSSGGPK